MQYRIWLTRQQETRYLSQLDVALILEQAIRRSGIPIGLSGEFNPRMKISYHSSLPVGVASNGEPIDLTLTQEFEPAAISKAIGQCLPSGFQIAMSEKIEKREKYFVFATYQIQVSYVVQESQIISLLQSSEIWIIRSRNSKRVNIRPYIIECKILHQNTAQTTLELKTQLCPEGSISVWEFLELLNIPLNDDALIQITRTLTLIPICKV